ncbi:MAG: TPM domain-containing protein [Mariprofundus sp.]
MKKIYERGVVLISLLLVLAGVAQAEVAIPPLMHRITDLTATLNTQQIKALESRLVSFETEKGGQMAVLIVPTTQPETIEQFGIRVVEAWKLGSKSVDDGALLLIAKNDHSLRIEVGYGLEGALTDATAHRIIDEVIVPIFKRGDFYQGIDSGLSAIIQVVRGELQPPPGQVAAKEKPDANPLALLAFALMVIGGLILRAWLGAFPAGLTLGGSASLILGFTGTPWEAALSSGVVVFVLVLWGPSAFVARLGGSAGGGLSGGGGSFGGGGASGGW